MVIIWSLLSWKPTSNLKLAKIYEKLLLQDLVWNRITYFQGLWVLNAEVDCQTNLGVQLQEESSPSMGHGFESNHLLPGIASAKRWSRLPSKFRSPIARRKFVGEKWLERSQLHMLPSMKCQGSTTGDSPQYIHQIEMVIWRKGFKWPRLLPILRRAQSKFSLKMCAMVAMTPMCGINLFVLGLMWSCLTLKTTSMREVKELGSSLYRIFSFSFSQML